MPCQLGASLHLHLSAVTEAQSWAALASEFAIDCLPLGPLVCLELLDGVGIRRVRAGETRLDFG